MRGKSKSARKEYWARLRIVIHSFEKPFTAIEVQGKYNHLYPRWDLTHTEITHRLRIMGAMKEIERINGLKSPAEYRVIE